MACKTCPSKGITKQVFNAAKALKVQRAKEWGKANGHLLVGIYEVYDDEEGETTWRFAAAGDPVLNDKNAELLWCI